MERVVPLYTEADMLPVLRQMVSVSYHRRVLVAPGMHVTFLDAGHVLGSAITVLDVDDGANLAVYGKKMNPQAILSRKPTHPTSVQPFLTALKTYVPPLLKNS